ncbi:hypothetical protein ABZY42_34640 [Streptomyces sp. NPDC006622]|uniref:hypothetical protein n=1 Tax=Streptomyces sp. NPDC006622 TaxID=3155459 RepID=UPI00339FD639
MSETGYRANVPGINRAAKELETLADKAGYLHQRFISDRKATDGWQGPKGCGDALADSLTDALAEEFAGITSALGRVEGLLRALSPASNMGHAVHKPVEDALGMIAEAGGRY